MDVIQTHQLTKLYPGGVTAVDGIDLEISEGEIFGFLGPNGAGKTTTIKMLTTLVKPTSGVATVTGFDVVKNPDQVRQNIGCVAQDMGVDEYATGRENLTLYGHFYRLDRKTIKERVDSLLRLVELTDYADKMAATYSGGMRKRLDIAMGLIQQPRIIFLDEPTTGLDPQTRSHMWDYIRDLSETMGITVFLTTHYMEEADQLAGRVAIIDRGQIMTIGSPQELKQSVRGDVITISPSSGSEEENRAHLTQAEKILSEQPFVIRTQVTNGEMAAYVENGERSVPALMRSLSEGSVPIGTLSISRPTLDDVFLKYTGRTMREEEGRATTFAKMHQRAQRRSGR